MKERPTVHDAECKTIAEVRELDLLVLCFGTAC